MDPKLEPFLGQAQEILKKGGVREIDFAGPTYQAEVFDHHASESFWPLLHFDPTHKLRDAFCSCQAMEEGCPHVAAAYLKITNTPSNVPLHHYFPYSFMCILFQCLVEHCGYEETVLSRLEEGHYKIDKPILFEIKAKTKEAKTHLTNLVEARRGQTPENSIQFSEVSAQEITWWKEGRPSAPLRFALSVFSDLAKWARILQFECPYQLKYQEGSDGLPNQFSLHWDCLEITMQVTHADLLVIIPALDTLHSPLHVYKHATGQIQKMFYQQESKSIQILHDHPMQVKSHQGIKIGQWLYQKGDGFYITGNGGFFDRKVIPQTEIVQALEEHLDEISMFLPIKRQPRKMKYQLAFDSAWSLCIQAFLFVPGDLAQQHAWIIHEDWVYLPQQGFVAIEGLMFETHEHIVLEEHISEFVNRYRVWLGQHKGFQAHLASIDSQLSYTVEDHTLCFHMKTQGLEGAKDFGDWMYYPSQGFFPKIQTRLGQVIRPGLFLNKDQISSFIKLNMEELEGITGFFAPSLPLRRCGLKMTVRTKKSITLEPVYEFLEEFQGATVEIYGDFVYLQSQGFYPLPPGMILPDEYQKPQDIEGVALHSFLTHDFPKIEKFIFDLDTRLKLPHQADVHIRYLVRTAKGGVKAELVLVTEYGEVAVSHLLEETSQKGGVVFTDAGLIDLREERFSWMRSCKASGQGQSTCEMSTLDFLRLDATVGVFLTPANNLQADITKMLLKELREFLVAQPPNLKGLKSNLRLYQQTGLQWLWFLYRNGLSGLLCDDMGLGKTHQAMALMCAIENQEAKNKMRCVIICPTSVIYHWQDKLSHFLPHLDVYTFHGVKRTFPSLNQGGVLLTSYGLLRVHKEDIKQIDFDLAIYDEVQVAKNPHSQVHEALKSISARMSLGLTGTPIENNLRELKALFDLVLPGYMPSENKFRDTFVIPIERDQDEEKKMLLTSLIKPFVLRRRKKEVLDELPEKTEDLAFCDLLEEQKNLYNETLEQNREALIQQLHNPDQAIPYMHVFSILTRLKQICNHPALIHKDPQNYAKYASGKWDLFVELVAEARASGHKIVIFSQYLYMLDIIELYVQSQDWGYAQIRGDTLDRKAELKRFSEDPNCVIFLGSLQAAGLGIDLTAANVVILYDRWWNAARENQAIDRVHRLGQKWAVSVFKLITKGTIEEKIDQMIHRKGQLMEEVVTADDQAALKKFTRSELLELLSYSSDETSREPQ